MTSLEYLRQAKRNSRHCVGCGDPTRRHKWCWRCGLAQRAQKQRLYRARKVLRALGLPA